MNTFMTDFTGLVDSQDNDLTPFKNKVDKLTNDLLRDILRRFQEAQNERGLNISEYKKKRIVAARLERKKRAARRTYFLYDVMRVPEDELEQFFNIFDTTPHKEAYQIVSDDLDISRNVADFLLQRDVDDEVDSLISAIEKDVRNGCVSRKALNRAVKGLHPFENELVEAHGS